MTLLLSRSFSPLWTVIDYGKDEAISSHANPALLTSCPYPTSIPVSLCEQRAMRKGNRDLIASSDHHITSKKKALRGEARAGNRHLRRLSCLPGAPSCVGHYPPRKSSLLDITWLDSRLTGTYCPAPACYEDRLSLSKFCTSLKNNYLNLLNNFFTDIMHIHPNSRICSLSFHAEDPLSLFSCLISEHHRERNFTHIHSVADLLSIFSSFADNWRNASSINSRLSRTFLDRCVPLSLITPDLFSNPLLHHHNLLL